MTFRRKMLLLVALVLGLFVVYVSVPLLAAVYWAHKIDSSIKVRTQYPGCVPGKEEWARFHCQCEFVFEDEKEPSKVSFEGTDLHYSYDPEKRTYRVSGTGTIQHGPNRIEIKSDRIIVNGAEIPPDRPSSFHVLIRHDGSLTSSRTEVVWPWP